MRRSLLLILTCAATVEAQWKLERVASTSADIDLGWIASMAAGKNGELFVADGKAQQIVVYDSTGKRARVIGRKGTGPLEFRRLTRIAWIGDTLAAFDDSGRRLTFVTPAGTLLRTELWKAPEYPSFLLGPGGSGLFAVAYGRGTPQPIPGIEGATRFVRPLKTLLRIDGDASMSNAGVSDSTRDALGNECWGPSKGTIYLFDETIGGNGPFNAFTTGGAFISLSTERAQILWRPAAGASRIAASYAAVPVTDAVWAREAWEYADAEKTEGKLTCDPAWSRPRLIPPIRSVVADDGGGIWAEITTANGSRYDLYDVNGKLVGSAASPKRRVQTIPFVVRGDRLFVVEKDADDVMSITTYRLTKR